MSLPSEAIDNLVGLLNSIEASLAWPQQAILNKLVFLTKPTGDDRSIGLGAFLFRLWQKVRSPVTRSWEEVWTQEWDTVKKGSNATKEALRRAVTSEVAVLKGLLSAAVVWDVTSFFDTVLPQVLIQHALELAYPGQAPFIYPCRCTWLPGSWSPKVPNTPILLRLGTPSWLASLTASH